ncbi:hypothetical protein [Hungatella hathewayi]|uniref:hypothetical protein n=1 Tax=Hungatella hathewayi TaxID=154046 RepID=UPI0035657D06
MTGQELYEKVRNGWKPTVRFTECVADSDSQYEENMMGKVISAKLDSHSSCIIFTIAEDRYSEFNKRQEQPIWYENPYSETCVTKSVLGGRKESDIVYECVDMELGNFEIVNDGILFLYQEYCRENPNKSYLSWLEDKVTKLEDKRENYEN